MFPRLRQQLLAHVDLLVELSTLGEYGIDEHGSTMRLEPGCSAERLAPRVRDRCAESSEPRRCAMAQGRAASARF